MLSRKANCMWSEHSLDVPALLERLSRRIRRWYQAKAAALSMTGPELKDLALECAGEAFSIALTVRDPREDGNPETFLNRASLQARKVAYKEFKSLEAQRRLESLDGDAPHPLASHEKYLLRHQCTEALQGLTEDQQQVLGLYYLQDQPVSEIARRMKLGEKAVRSILERGRARARKLDAERQKP